MSQPISPAEHKKRLEHAKEKMRAFRLYEQIPPDIQECLVKIAQYGCQPDEVKAYYIRVREYLGAASGKPEPPSPQTGCTIDLSSPLNALAPATPSVGGRRGTTGSHGAPLESVSEYPFGPNRGETNRVTGSFSHTPVYSDANFVSPASQPAYSDPSVVESFWPMVSATSHLSTEHLHAVPYIPSTGKMPDGLGISFPPNMPGLVASPVDQTMPTHSSDQFGALPPRLSFSDSPNVSQSLTGLHTPPFDQLAEQSRHKRPRIVRDKANKVAKPATVPRRRTNRRASRSAGSQPQLENTAVSSSPAPPFQAPVFLGPSPFSSHSPGTLQPSPLPFSSQPYPSRSLSLPETASHGPRSVPTFLPQTSVAVQDPYFGLADFSQYYTPSTSC